MLKIMSTVSADWEADEPEIRDFSLEQENTKSTYEMPFLSEKTISYNVSEDGAVIVYLGTADAPYAEPEWTKLGSEEAGSSETYKKQLDAVEYVASSVGKSLKK